MTLAQVKQKPAKKKSAAQRLWFLHWLMTFFYILLFVGGYYIARLPDSFSFREIAFDSHKTLGVVVMSLLLARISVLLLVFQRKHRRNQPKHKSGWAQTVVLHITLYVFMLLAPLSGFFDSNVGGHDVRIFGTGIVLPPLFAVNKALDSFGDSVHFWISYTFLAFIILHSIDQKKYLQAQVRRFVKGTLPKFLSGLRSKGN